MTLSIGPATDSIYAKAQTAAAGVTVNSKPMLVIDGEPDELAYGMFAVGASEPPPEAPAGETAAQLTYFTAELTSSSSAEFPVPCYIDVRVPGRTQKTARDIVSTVFNAFVALLAADPSLGGALGQGRAEIDTVTYVTSNVGSAAEPGRRQLARFTVKCISV